MPGFDALTFQLYLPNAEAASPAVQLKSLVEGDVASPAAPILGIANFEVTLQLADHSIALGNEDAEAGAINNVAEDLAGTTACPVRCILPESTKPEMAKSICAKLLSCK